mmetsp:Transcript_23362/g.62645  ORF Transcript_23362/g.62645 Transcript_23362/m.62645 type:complete len:159 (+) Transcript_23362:61-537(+)
MWNQTHRLEIPLTNRNPFIFAKGPGVCRDWATISHRPIALSRVTAASALNKERPATTLPPAPAREFPVYSPYSPYTENPGCSGITEQKEGGTRLRLQRMSVEAPGRRDTTWWAPKPQPDHLIPTAPASWLPPLPTSQSEMTSSLGSQAQMQGFRLPHL